MNFINFILIIVLAPSVSFAEDEVKSVEMNSGMVRSVYLNDIDVTSATNQKLKMLTLRSIVKVILTRVNSIG